MDIVWVTCNKIRKFQVIMAIFACLFVNNDMDFDTLFCLAFQDSIKSVFRVLGRGATEVQFGSKPPVLSFEPSVKHIV